MVARSAFKTSPIAIKLAQNQPNHVFFHGFLLRQGSAWQPCSEHYSIYWLFINQLYLFDKQPSKEQDQIKCFKGFFVNSVSANVLIVNLYCIWILITSVSLGKPSLTGSPKHASVIYVFDVLHIPPWMKNASHETQRGAWIWSQPSVCVKITGAGFNMLKWVMTVCECAGR